MKNFKVIFIAFILGAIAYHFGKPFLAKKLEKKIDDKLDSELNNPETIEEINDSMNKL